MQTQTIVPSLADAISATLVKGEKKKSSKNGFPVIDDRELREHVDLQVEAAANEKKAKAENSFHKIAIANHVRKIMDRDGYAGRFSGTYVVLGNSHAVNCTFTNKWQVKDEATLRSLLGEAFDRLFERRLTVKLKKEVLENPEKAHRLMELIGHEFVDFFESEELLALRDKEDIYHQVPEDKLESFRNGALQDAPSIKYVSMK